jgi:hypothetical protein
VVFEEPDGKLTSVLLDLRPNLRDQLDVRVASGAYAWEGGRVWELSAPGESGVRATDLVADTVTTLALAPDAALLAVERGHAWYRSHGRTVDCEVATGRCVPTTEIPDLPTTFDGPGPGFRLLLDGDALRLALPQDEAGTTVYSPVSRLVGVAWVRGGGVASERVLNRTFRGFARIDAEHASGVVVDADLAEWSDAAPFVVEDPWQFQYGADAWGGPRDASFSVAAAWTDERLCFAGRVRDDVVAPGDILELQAADRSVRIPLDADDGIVESGRTSFAIARSLFDVTWEACVPGAGLGDTIPFAASFEDVDGDEHPTRLVSAPSRQGMPLGTVVRIRE